VLPASVCGGRASVSNSAVARFGLPETFWFPVSCLVHLFSLTRGRLHVRILSLIPRHGPSPFSVVTSVTHHLASAADAARRLGQHGAKARRASVAQAAPPSPRQR
jgi:hypothetical protein